MGAEDGLDGMTMEYPGEDYEWSDDYLANLDAVLGDWPGYLNGQSSLGVRILRDVAEAAIKAIRDGREGELVEVLERYFNVEDSE